MNLTYKNPRTGFIRRAPIGFSWTTFFFGPIPALVRNDWKWTIIILLCALFTFGLSSVFFACIYNARYAQELEENGYILDETPNQKPPKLNRTSPIAFKDKELSTKIIETTGIIIGIGFLIIISNNIMSSSKEQTDKQEKINDQPEVVSLEESHDMDIINTSEIDSLIEMTNIIKQHKTGKEDCKEVTDYMYVGKDSDGSNFYSISCITKSSFMIGINTKTNRLNMLHCDVYTAVTKNQCFTKL
jgi:uncharacterized membrane protein